MTIKEHIAENLPYIDKNLSLSGVPLSGRILNAAVIYVKEFVLEVKGGDKDDFEGAWFAFLYQNIKEWYQENYGPALSANAHATATGVVLVRDVPVAIEVPLTRGAIETPGKTAWLHFPVLVEDGESPETWLINSPPLEKLSKSERRKLDANMTKVATGLRHIRINLMGIEPDDEIVRGFLEGILADFESAARNILRQDSTGRGAALWSLQMAVEKILKAFAQHKTYCFRKSHDLFQLYDDIKHHNPAVNRELLKKMPENKKVTIDRYGLGGIPEITEVMESYCASLAFVSQMSKSFEHHVYIGGARFLIEKAPWITPPEINKKS